MESVNFTQKEPIAIVGIGCRFPGNASSPEKFWDLLCKGIDAIVEVPKDRWDSRRFYDPDVQAAGKMYVNQGGFLNEKWEDFDAEFFHISPREAKFVDPQQRLLLELAWEAMEDGGIVPDNIRGSDAAVFIGGFTTDWQTLHNSPHNRNHCGNYSGINSSKTILSARIAHFFDLRGPCFTLDTACSSSLVAVHLACQNLWQNECSLALAGGINAMLVPETTIAMAKGRFLNPEGRCRTFDADAKGYVRGEGGGIVILRRLSEALRDRNPIYALIRGTGINQDGHTHGIAQPNAEAQKQLIQKVLCDSGVSPWRIHYVETHGTGTPVGDPAEAMALNHVLEDPKRSHPCYIGAVKSNFGHLEAAAGIAGLIKTALCLKHKQIPPNLHFKTANPNIPFEKYCLKIPTTIQDFPSQEQAHFGCVNAFGYGGTNAHAVMQSHEVSERKIDGIKPEKPFLFPFSAKNAESLKDAASTFAQFLDANPDVNLFDIAYTLSKRRSLFEYRLAASAESSQELKNKLDMFSKGENPEGCAYGKNMEVASPLVFVYTGMGPQWWGMARQLIQTSAIFLETLQQCDCFIASLTHWSLISELLKDEENSRIGHPEIAPVANYAIQAALTALLKSWGVIPDAIVGHSVGEVAACYASGALSLEDGLLVSYHRSRLQASRNDQGAMLAVGLDMEGALPILKQYPEKISVAAQNGPNSLTLSGSKDALVAIAASLEQGNIFNRFLKVNIAYHSHQLDGLENDVLTSLESLKPKTPVVPQFSTVYAELFDEIIPDAQYWWKNIRQPVLFAQTIQKMIDKGFRLYVEIGPHPVLANFIRDSLHSSQVKGEILPTLNRKKPDIVSLMECLGGLFVHGHPIDWEKLHPHQGHFIRLPAYSWQKKKHWIESEESRQYRLSSRGHVMLSRKLKISDPTWKVEVNRQYFPWLEDHQIDGSIVFPASAYIEAALAIHSTVHEKSSCILEDVDFLQPLIIPLDKEPLLQISLEEESKLFKAQSLPDPEEWDWICHAKAKCYSSHLHHQTKVELNTIRKGVCYGTEAIYNQFVEQGLEYGPTFRCIKNLWKGNKEALAEIAAPNNNDGYHIHPALLDSALQTLIGAIDPNEYKGGVILPCHMDKVIFYSSPEGSVFCHAICTKITQEKVIGNLFICDAFGNVFVEIQGFQCKILANDLKLKADKLAYHPVWEESPFAKTSNDKPDKPQWLFGFASEDSYRHLTKSCTQNNIYSRIYPLSSLNSLEDTEKLIASLIPADKFNAEAQGRGVAGNKMFATRAPSASPRPCASALNLLADATQMPHLTVMLAYDRKSIDDGHFVESETQIVKACVNLVKALENQRNRNKQPVTLLIVTKGTQSIGEKNGMNLAGASLWGLGRVIRQEYSDWRCRLIDLEDEEGVDWDTIVQEFMESDPCDEVAYRGGKRYQYKLKKSNDEQEPEKVPLSSNQSAFCLDLKKAGRIENLFYQQVEKKSAGPKEVEIQVHTSSINFKDLMKVMGLLDQNVFEDTYFGASFGMECSGIITTLGSKVSNYQVGEKVCAFIPNTFQSYITLPVQAIYPIPAGLTLEEAPVYVPFITVLRALRDIAKLKKGETVLIHSATGAVGLAAIQYAQYVGARIIATAGNEEKRNFLREQGIGECADSRSLAFVDDVLRWTKGKGVDVVLNSLAGESLAKSWSVVAPYGRFIEIGKRDISMNQGLPMRYFDRNTLFASIDLDKSFIDQPRLIQRLFKEAYTLFKKGIFKPLPCQSFLADQAVEAFQFMARSKHIGKITLKFEGQTVHGVPLQKAIVQDNYSYLITGGLSGFGMIVANWFVEKGARHLILLGRRGASSLEAQEMIQRFKKEGITVKVASVDVANADQLNHLLEECSRKMPPLKGIIHSAMVINDAFLSQTTLEGIEQVFSPKVAGCLNLHRLTSNYSLDFFILFSSISSIIGNPGQGSYAAANAFLDSFCHYRRRLGLPALTINWGALKTGILERNLAVAQHLENHGIKRIPIKIALQILERALVHDVHQLCGLDMDWEKLGQGMPQIKESLAFADFFVKKNQQSSLTDFVERLCTMEAGHRLSKMMEMIKETIAQTLKMNAAQLDISVRLNALGVDSLMAMELQTSMEASLGIKIPSMELMKGPTIEQLGRLCLKLLKL